MNLGYVKLYRRTLDSRVFQNEGLLKVWVWCLLKANHKGQWVPVKTGKGTTEVWVAPGQFIFGRKSASKELKMAPTTVRDRLAKLQVLDQITLKSDTHYSIISIVNWNTYQIASENDDTQPTPNRHPTDTNKNDKNEKKEKDPDSADAPSDLSFSCLRQRYSDQSLIDQVFQALASTRKTGKIRDSVLLAQLQKWERYPVEQVDSAFRIYLEKNYASEGKRENYLLGIIRNQQVESQKPESSGSRLLDTYAGWRPGDGIGS